MDGSSTKVSFSVRGCEFQEPGVVEGPWAGLAFT